MRGLNMWWQAEGRIQLLGRPGPRRFAATRAEALLALDDFVATRLGDFGPFEDAMLAGDPVMAHSLLSVPLNLGLLNPAEVIDRVLAEFAAGRAQLASVEGVVRQLPVQSEDPCWPRCVSIYGRLLGISGPR